MEAFSTSIRLTGIPIAPIGFTKDARTTVAREYCGRIVMWDAEKLAQMFLNYGIEAPEIEEETEEKKEEKSPSKRVRA